MDILSLSNNRDITGITQSTTPIEVADTETKNSQTANANGILGKDDFLKLLVTQLKYQDPSKPMEDKEFIAQMAQFTSLEQMTNMSNNFKDVSVSVNKNYALSLLGKHVEVNKNGNVIHGVVSEVGTGTVPQVGIDGVLYNLKDISRVGKVQEVQ